MLQAPNADRHPPSVPMIVACLAAVYIVWGTTYYAIKVGLEGAGPYFLLGTRFVLAGSVLLVVLRVAGQPLPSLRQWRNAAALSFLMIVLGIGAVAVAEQWVSSGATVALISINPLATAIWAAVFGRRPRPLAWLAIAIGAAGTLVMVLGQDLSASPPGTALILLGVLAWTLGANLSRRLEVPPGAMGFAAEMLAGGLLTLLVSALLGESWVLPDTARVWWAWGYLVVFGSLVAFSAFRYLSDNVSPTLASTYAYVNPPVALFVGWWLGSESFTSNIFIGLPIVLGAVALQAWAELTARAGRLSAPALSEPSQP